MSCQEEECQTMQEVENLTKALISAYKYKKETGAPLLTVDLIQDFHKQV